MTFFLVNYITLWQRLPPDRELVSRVNPSSLSEKSTAMTGLAAAALAAGLKHHIVRSVTWCFTPSQQIVLFLLWFLPSTLLWGVSSYNMHPSSTLILSHTHSLFLSNSMVISGWKTVERIKEFDLLQKTHKKAVKLLPKPTNCFMWPPD